MQEVGRRWGAAEAMELLSSAADDPFFTQLLSFVAEPNPVQAGALVITVYVRLQTGTCRIDGLQPSDNVRLIEEKTAAKSGVREGFRLYLNSKLLDSLSTLHESQVCNGAFIEMKMLGPGGMQLTTSQEEALSIAFSDEPEEGGGQAASRQPNDMARSARALPEGQPEARRQRGSRKQQRRRRWRRERERERRRWRCEWRQQDSRHTEAQVLRRGAEPHWLAQGGGKEKSITDFRAKCELHPESVLMEHALTGAFSEARVARAREERRQQLAASADGGG